MAKSTEDSKAVQPSEPVFKTGVNLAPLAGETDERRYEAGDPVPAGLTKMERDALIELGAIDAGEDK